MMMKDSGTTTTVETSQRQLRLVLVLVGLALACFHMSQPGNIDRMAEVKSSHTKNSRSAMMEEEEELGNNHTSLAVPESVVETDVKIEEEEEELKAAVTSRSTPAPTSLRPATAAPTPQPTMPLAVTRVVLPQQQLAAQALQQQQQQAPQDSSSSHPYLTSRSYLDWEQSSNAFISAVHDNAETTALNTWLSPDMAWEIPPLDHNLLQEAFGGRKVAFVGDSTLFYMRQWIHYLMEEATPQFIDSLKTLKLTNAFNKVQNFHNTKPQKDIYRHVYQAYSNADILWKGFRGGVIHMNCNFKDNVWPKIQEVKPEIMIANWGLHMSYRKGIKLCNMFQWVHYEDILRQYISNARKAGVKLLLFKTTNLICLKWTGINLQQQCMEEMPIKNATKWDPINMRTVSNADLQEYCAHGGMTAEGSLVMNERMLQVVDQAQQDPANAGMKIAVYNDHDMETCDYTKGGDGRHYHPLNLPRIRLLAYTINSLYPRGDNDESKVVAAASMTQPTTPATPASAVSVTTPTSLSAPANMGATALTAATTTINSLATAASALTVATTTNALAATQPAVATTMCPAGWELYAAAYSQEVARDPERTWAAAIAGQVPPLNYELLQHAFAGKRVALIGDSSLFYMQQTIHYLLQEASPSFLTSLTSKTLTSARAAWQQAISSNKQKPGQEVTDMVYPSYNGAHIMWKGWREAPIGDANCHFDDLVWPAVREQRPDIIVANWGIQMLHKPVLQACNVHQWVHYEEWLQSVVTLAKEVGTKLVLFKTTNLICREQKQNPDIQKQQCLKKAANFHAGNDPVAAAALTDTQIQQYCEDAAKSHGSEEHLNERLQLFVQQAQRDPSNASIKIVIYNDYDMESCSMTPDGLHYHKLRLPRIRLLAHMMTCLSDSSGSAS